MTNAERVKYFFPFWIDMAVPVFMIISGYTYAESYRKNNIVCISEAYKPEFLINKIIRYTCPFVIAYVLEIFIHIFLKDAISIKSILATFLVGGEGPGSYYYPIMIQFIFVYPVIYFIIKKFKYNGVILCGILNFIYELLKSAYGVSLSTYRLLIFRYVLIIAVGCYTTMEKKHLSVKKSVLYTICGMSFLILYSYTGYKPIILKYWTTTSFLACLYIIPVMMIILTWEKKITCKGLELLGKASFHIYLIQMVYYNFFSERVYALVSSGQVRIIINIIICIVVGLVFYWVERPVTKLMVSLTRGWIKCAGKPWS